MRKNVLVYGLLSGLIIAVIMVYSTTMCYKSENFEGNMWLGYTSMVLAFSLIFLGIRNYRDKFNGGFISFGKAFKTGLLIALVGSTIYVVTWLVDYYVFIPDFMEKYTEHIMKQAAQDGATPLELSKKAEEMKMYSDMYRNPLFVVILTYTEVFPVGLLIALISALVLKRKPQDGIPA